MTPLGKRKVMLCHMFCLFWGVPLEFEGEHISIERDIWLYWVLVFFFFGRERNIIFIDSFLNQWGTYFLCWGRKYVYRSPIFFSNYRVFIQTIEIFICGCCLYMYIYIESFSLIEFIFDWGRFVIFFDCKLGTFHKRISRFPWMQDWWELLRFWRWVVAVSLPPSNGGRRRRSAGKVQAVIHLNRKCYTPENYDGTWKYPLWRGEPFPNHHS